ncbi:metal ABC transporter permease [Diplocloster hominis]|uniref:metal ABC transporter permease n=1 Tax=Diplocloster hominis TaxID=3079010 RepID=UPI0031BB5344
MIYELLESVLPFSWVQYDFMKQAFLAILLITPLFGILGTMIVNHKMAFFSDALGHSALTGVAVGVLFGIPDTNLAMLIFAVLFALALNQIKSRNLMATDTVISVFSSFSIAVGLVILAQGGNFSKYSSLLVGDILSITPREILYLVLLLIGTLIFWILCSNQLNSISINRSLAASRGIRVKLIENLFAVCIAVIVMLSIKWVGILIINALLILPAASARNISENMREYHFFSILFSLFSGIVGLIISYYVNTATGPTIVIIASVIFFATYFYSRHGK